MMFELTEIGATFLYYNVWMEFHPAFIKYETWWKKKTVDDQLGTESVTRFFS